MRSRIIRLASATLVLLSCMSSAVIHTTPATHPDAVRYASAAYMRLPLSFEAKPCSLVFNLPGRGEHRDW